MKTIGTLIVISMLLIFLIPSKCTFVGQTEIAFEYHVLSGKPVSPEENPLLSKGFHFRPFAWNKRFFDVSSEIQEYTFKADGRSGNEALQWDSEEGVTMATDYTIRGRVLDPWLFYINYGKSDFDYGSVFKGSRVSDEKTYEALRQAGHYAGKVMIEITENREAEDIRINRNDLKVKLLAELKPYCEKFGFSIEDIIFPERFVYPDGNVIEEARRLITDTGTKIRQQEQEYENALAQKAVDVAQAGIEANKIIEEGTRDANKIDRETMALAEELKGSIDQIGPDATVKLKMAELNGALTKTGVIKEVILTEDSLFAAPFYAEEKTAESEKPRVLKFPEAAETTSAAAP